MCSAFVKCPEIPIAHTPSGGYGPSFPPLILGNCTEPLVEGAPDLRGIWKVVAATRGGEVVAPDDRLMSYTERIEQCGNRIVDCGGGTIADARADGTEENGVLLIVNGVVIRRRCYCKRDLAD